MIFDTLENTGCYAGLSENFRKAFAFMQSRDFSREPTQRFEIDGDQVFAFIADVPQMPVEQERYEAHRKYADIQLVLDGGERMRVLPLPCCQAAGAFDEEKDIGFYTAGPGAELTFEKGDFAVYFPQDAHMPCCRHPQISHSRKLVIKVRV